MQRKDLLWILAYLIYQMLSPLRYEAGHALAGQASVLVSVCVGSRGIGTAHVSH